MKLISLILLILLIPRLVNAEVAKPPRPGSYLYLKVIEKETGKNIKEVTFNVKIKHQPPYDIYDQEYQFKASNLPEKIYFTMPPSHATAYITAIVAGYKESEPLIITSEFYWENVPSEKPYLLEHIFEVEKGKKAVRFVGDAATPTRENMPEIPGSYIIVNVIDNSTLEEVDVSKFYVEMKFESPHDYLNANFTIQKLNQSLYFTMPPPHYSAKAYIYAKKEGYYDSEPLIIDNSFYWKKINEPSLEYLIKHTFYLTPKKE